MKKISLKIYKGFQQYFNLLDILIKNVSSNKELYLENINISPSSYRRVKKEGNKIGETILAKLVNHFNYLLCSEELIDEIEVKINKIYYDIYYKDYENYQAHYQWLNEMIEKRYIVFPILKMFKLLMIINDIDSPTFVIPENQDLYDEIKQYESFFGNELLEIIEIFDVTFKKDIDDYFLSKNYSNELTYHTLATRCYMMKRYLESIYFCNIVKEKYIDDENYKRVFYINFTLIANYNFLLKFKDANLLAKKQLRTLKSTNNRGLEYEYTIRTYVITCLGLKKYDEIIDILTKKSKLKLTEVVSLLISYFFIDKKEYLNLYSELSLNDNKSDTSKCVKLVDLILQNNNKKIVNQLENFNINKCILEILKKM